VLVTNIFCVFNLNVDRIVGILFGRWCYN